MDTLTLVGTIASIFGAVISLWGAYQAIKAKNQIIKKVRIEKFSRLKANAIQTRLIIRNQMLETKKRRGFNKTAFSKSILEFYENIIEEKSSLKTSGYTDVELNGKIVIDSINELKLDVDEQRFSELVKILYDTINSIISSLAFVSTSEVEGDSTKRIKK
ncbi:MAG TPA: hypothetical protein VJ861_03050 [Treponemataceae bacterium]|nr:hypothetical protein [Treponemataceae bacterium]